MCTNTIGMKSILAMEFAHVRVEIWPGGYKTFFHVQLRTKFILLIIVKMPA